MSDKPIFYDATGRRALGASVVGWIAGVISLVLGAAFAVTLATAPILHTKVPYHFTAISIADLEKKAKAPGLVRSAARLATEARARAGQRTRDIARNERNVHNLPLAALLRPQADRPLTIAFLPNWGYGGGEDPRDSLMQNLAKLDWLMPTWLALQGDKLDLVDMIDKPLLAEIRSKRPNLVILPTLQNAANESFNGPGLAELLADKTRTAALIEKLVAIVGDNKLQGLTIDLENVPKEAHPDLEKFLRALSSAFRPHGWLIAMAAPFDDVDWPYKAYAGIADYTVLMAYDQHDDQGEAGSIAGQDWFEANLDLRMRDLAPSRTIIAVGNYAYDWNGGKANDLSFEEAVIAAHDSEAPIDFDGATNNPHFSYIEDDHTRHDVWFLDGVTAYNQIHASDVYRPAGYALWRLGTEDSTVWQVFSRPYDAGVPQGFSRLPVAGDLDYEGQGEFLRIDAQPETGARTLEIDAANGDINDETYTQIPTNYVVRQFGYKPGKIALTFDDGPDPEWTPQILDILKQKNVKATFFIIGANAAANPELVQRILDEGHDVGNHTYTHPNLSDTPAAGVPIELNATQRLFEALTGRSLVLFRPPYLGDAEPDDPSDMLPIEIAQSMGYITLGEHIDPVDWSLPGVDQIVKRSLAPLDHPVGDARYANTILLHDAGGDRSQTVAALPVLIDKLRARGFQFVRASQLLGMTRDQANPRLSLTLLLLTDRIVFTTMNWFGRFLYFAFLTAIWLGVSRLFFLGGLSLWDARRERAQLAAAPEQAIHVSVIVPAYNEEKVIVRTVERLLASDHHDLEVIAVDDGSQDRTSAMLHEAFGTDPRVRIITKPNGGKAEALNVGLASATGEIVVALDADTLFQHDTIPRLVRWFADPKIGAVAGNAKVGNRTDMITRWQALEYIVAQNLERRALAAIGTLTVIPGAVGAWRKSVLATMGGFTSDTLAEDQDLTIKLQVKGAQVRFDSTAIAWTEAPNSFGGLAKQRFRWSFGTLQCLWKYRSLLFNPRYGSLGMIALPQVWLFQIILTALAPLADLLLIWQLVGQWIAYIQHGAEFSNTDLITVGIYYLVFVMVDMLAATFGFLLERGENWNLLWWLPLQRFGYRQLMYYVVVRSISAAVRGAVVGWGKLERTGTVQANR